MRARREQTPEHTAAHRLYEMERCAYGRRGGAFALDLVTRVLDRFERQSIVSGKRTQLRLRRFWPDLPFSEWNAAVVTARENNTLARSKDWLACFPAPFVEAMRRNRTRYEEILQQQQEEETAAPATSEAAVDTTT
jgi:hypothetical protein